METNKDPVLSGILGRLQAKDSPLCSVCQQQLAKLLSWHSYIGLSKAQILETEIHRILRDEPPEDERRVALEQLFSIKDPDLLKYFYLYQAGITGHLFHYAYLSHRYNLLNSK